LKSQLYDLAHRWAVIYNQHYRLIHLSFLPV
jgi:hypothetical protein